MPKLNRINALAAFWGLAEATVFFIVPDVLLSWVALRSFKRAMWACLWALLGALAGGAIIWFLGSVNPEPLRSMFVSLPGIGHAMLGDVREQLQNDGLLALFIGPMIGTPYKIYALEAANLGIGLFVFLLVSVPARLMRFAIVTVVSAVAGRYLGKLVGLRVLQVLHVLVWITFYAWYYHAMSAR